MKSFVLPLAALALALPLHAQTPVRAQAALVPDSARVGDVFHAAIRVEVPAATRVQFPDTLAVPADVENAGSVIVQTDTIAPGQLSITAAWPMTSWRPGAVVLPDAWVRIDAGGASDSVRAAFPAVQVLSVLPADTAGVEPRPARDVLGANRLWWPLLLALLVALSFAAALLWWWRRRRPAVAMAPAPIRSPREVALVALARARTSGLVEAGDFRGFYFAVTEAIRHYAAALDARLGAELTTTEIAASARGLGMDTEAAVLVGILGRADLVKFARVTPRVEEALREWETARAWVERFDGPPPVHHHEPAEAIAA
jgi:hypothetical protein